MADFRDYGHTYLTLDRKVSVGGSTPKGGWVALFYYRVFPDRTNPQHNIEVMINREMSQRVLEEFIALSARDATPWFFHEDSQEVGRRVLVYTAIRDMIVAGELKKTISYKGDGRTDRPYARRNK